MKTTVDSLDKAVEAELDGFFNASLEDLGEAAKAAGKAAVRELKNTSPKSRGSYAKGWTSKEEKTRTGTAVTVYNKDRYMLAHLLEYGHPKVNGGRVAGTVHIKPVETAAMNTFETELKRRMESGT